MKKAIAGAVTLALLLGLAFAGVVLSVLTSNNALAEQQQCADGSITLPSAEERDGGIETVARAALRAGWTGDDAVVAVAVAGAESTYDPEAANASSTARGLWQIMMSYHEPKFDGDDWRDPYANARVAHEIWADSGWQPWVAYTSGAYKSHVTEARAAIESVQAQGTTVTAAVEESDQQEGLQDVAQRGYDVVRDQFAFTGTIGGFADRNIAGTSSRSKHGMGLAIDVMTSDPAVGDPIAEFFAGPGYEAYGIDNVIWRGRIYNAARGWHDYRHPSGENTATLAHYDHVHIDFDSDGGSGVAPVASTQQQQCVQSAASGGTATYPVPAQYVSTDRQNWGRSGGLWADGHTGTDFSAPCGTEVLAAHDGTVEIDTTQGWAGPELVKVSTGPTSLTTWYAHMQAVSVQPGDQVVAGQPLGQIGSEGNSIGCHLHFEVHPENGSIYADNVNPSQWLADNVGQAVGGVDATTVSAPPTAATGDAVSVASFNVLGSSHTRGAGGRPPGTKRILGVPRLLDRYAVDVVGFQEFERDQKRTFARATRGEWALWHPRDDTANTIGWRAAQFQRVDQGVVRSPYFDRLDKAFPWVRLRDQRGREFIVLDVHNPADTRGPAQWKRDRGERIQLRFAAQAARAGIPLFYVGDMNDGRKFYCPAYRSGIVHASAGPPRGDDCRMPPRTGIDWVTATRDVEFVDHLFIDDAAVDAVGDHPLVVGRGRL